MNVAYRCDALTGGLGGDLEIENQVGIEERGVELEQPIDLHSAGGVAGERGEKVPVGDDGFPVPQRR
jgi:hypothetical protein